MSHHSTVVNPQTDITDLYIFSKPGDASRSIFIMNIHPFARVPTAVFSSEASYEFKIDTNGDAETEVAFHVVFSPASDEPQTAAVYRITGEAARGNGACGEMILRAAPVSYETEALITKQGDYQFYAGIRSDSWFADVDGFFNNFQFAGKDTFANANILGIVLDIPNSALGPNAQIGIWARTVALVDGEWGQVDQAGRSLVPVLFTTTDHDRYHFLETPPSHQRGNYLSAFVSVLQTVGGYSEADAARIAGELLPDILQYDYSRPAGYPNGRRLRDDLLDTMLAIYTNGKATTDLVGPHTDLLDVFPYLGEPHRAESI
jgi:hypothetical protein